MSNYDLANNIKVTLLETTGVVANGTSFSPTFNINGFSSGFFITAISTVANYTDGNYIITLQDSVDGITFADVPLNKLIDPSFPGEIVISGATIDGAEQPRIGAISTDTLLRAKIVATGVSSGAKITFNVMLAADLVPA